MVLLVSILECTQSEREADKERDRDRERVPVVLRVLARIHRERSSSGTFCSSRYFFITPEDSGLKPGNRRRASPTHLSWARGFDAKHSALVALC